MTSELALKFRNRKYDYSRASLDTVSEMVSNRIIPVYA